MNLENLDGKLKRVKGECEAIKQAKDSLESEYENYKVSIHFIPFSNKSPKSSCV